MSNFLLELFSEEIPARMQKQALADAAKIWAKLCSDHGLSYDQISTFITPRRLTVHINALPLTLPSVNEEIKGPRVGAPEAALQGFMKKNGLNQQDLTEQETPKGAFYVAVKTKPAVDVTNLLPTLIQQFLTDFRWPKSMRWGENSFRWVRPLHNILALFEGKAVQGEVNLGHDVLPFTDKTYGHRFLKNEALDVTDFESYQKALTDAFVMLDTEDRKADIHRQLTALALKHNIHLTDDPALLQEMAGAAEWPRVFMGKIPEDYVDLPDEVLSTAMRVHQKYFAFHTDDQKLAPFFATVANNEPHDQGHLIIEGNEQILASRLFDAHFFWHQDLKADFKDWSKHLNDITFHEKLGTVHDKITRMGTLGSDLAEITGANATHVKRAAELAKIDLVSGMVFEFPELQGIMGGHYALAKGEHADIALAIKEHYAPAGPSDTCPTQPVSVALALADKLDTLVGFFGIDQKPTGSKDPFALRRAALGLIRLLLDNKISISLEKLIQLSVKSYGTKITDPTQDLLSFIKDRLKVALKDKGHAHDDVMAVIHACDNVLLIANRAHTLENFLKNEDGQNLLSLYRRASSLLKKETTDQLIIDKQLLTEAPEIKLVEQLEALTPQLEQSLAKEDYLAAMTLLVPLKPVIDTFFDEVTVNAEQSKIKENRHAILYKTVELVNRIADFSKIEG